MKNLCNFSDLHTAILVHHPLATLAELFKESKIENLGKFLKIPYYENADISAISSQYASKHPYFEILCSDCKYWYILKIL